MKFYKGGMLCQLTKIKKLENGLYFSTIVISKIKTKEKQKEDFKPNEKHWNGKENSNKSKKQTLI